MTTDLYIGTLRRRPVAMAPRVADAEERMKASERKVLISTTESVVLSWRCQALVVLLLLLFKKAGKSLSDLIEL